MNSGLLYAALAYTLWGLFPLYFRQLTAVPALEIVVQRSVWSLVFVLLLLAVLHRWAWLSKALRQPKQLGLFALSASILSGNWLVYVWAVNHDRLIDASLGYFINPLVNVLLGYVVLHERLRRAQVAAVALAALGVLWLTWQGGQPPWIALALGISFAFYALMRKTASLGALEGFALETLLLAPVMLPLLTWWTWQGTSALRYGDISLVGWLLLAGPFTAVPLLFFAAGARRTTMATLGLLQYITPTLHFALGVWLYREPFAASRLVGFVMIWLALCLYSFEGWWFARRRRELAIATA